MLSARPSMFSWDYSIFEGRSFIATLSLAWLREKGAVTIDGRSFEMGRDNER